MLQYPLPSEVSGGILTSAGFFHPEPARLKRAKTIGFYLELVRSCTLLLHLCNLKFCLPHSQPLLVIFQANVAGQTVKVLDLHEMMMQTLH